MGDEVKGMVDDAEVAAAFTVMRQLCPRLDEGDYPSMSRRTRSSDGHRLAAVADEERTSCVADFRISEFLASDTFLYVSNLVTDDNPPFREHGERMVDRLASVACEEGCGSLQLDPGMQRHESHTIYFREGKRISPYHLSRAL